MELLLRRIEFCIMIVVYIIILLAVVSYIISLAKIDISKYEVVSEKIPKEFDGFKILQLSDIHNRNFGKESERLIKKIDAEKPDIIVVTGDMVSSNVTDFSRFFSLMEKLGEKYTVYYIFGNHEQRLSIENQGKIVEKLRALKINVLNNDEVHINKGTERIKIYGLQQNLIYYNNYLKYRKEYKYTVEDMSQIFDKPNDKVFNILLSHNPLYFETYEKWGADLVFSGHVHGGLIRFPLLGGIISPERKLFPRYSGGKYEINDSNMIVSRGLGNSTINLRVFNNPEICVVELKTK